MKRVLIAAVQASLLALGSYTVFAQQQPGPPQGQMGGMMGQGQMGRGMMGQGQMGHGMMMPQGPGGGPCPVCGAIAGGMMQKVMVATSDGGVIVALGNKLVKYDGNLNKVKEATLDMDVNQMHQKMQQMRQQQGGMQNQQ